MSLYAKDRFLDQDGRNYQIFDDETIEKLKQYFKVEDDAADLLKYMKNNGIENTGHFDSLDKKAP